MAMVPSNMDGFLQEIETTDTYKRLSLGDALLNYLSDESNSIDCSDIGQFIDKLVIWFGSSSFKVAQKGLEAMTGLLDRMGYDFKTYIQTIIPPVLDRLGDNKDSVRERAQGLLMKILEKEVLTPQQLIDRISGCFTHKNGKIREETLICFVNVLNIYGTHSLTVSKVTPSIVKLFSDPMPCVRDQAFKTLIEIYQHVGEKLRHDLMRKHSALLGLSASRMQTLMSKFDELLASGNLHPTATTTPTDVGCDEEDSVKVHKSNARKPVALARKSQVSSSTPAGAMDEGQFIASFEDVPTVQIFSLSDLKESLSKTTATISNSEADWDKRTEAFKRIRSLIIAGATSYEEFPEYLKKLEYPVDKALKDLRSQVVREACVTVAFLSQQLGSKFSHFAEVVLPTLITLISNSAKVISTAGIVCVRFIIQNTHSHRLIPIITSNCSSKSKEIRRAMCEVLDQLLHTWPTQCLERRIPMLQDAVKKGVSDADSDARISARKAFWGFKDHFPEQADSLLKSLDSSYKKMLYGDISASSSSSSLNTLGPSRYTQSSTRNRGLNSAPVEPKPIPVNNRSNSAIDFQAAQRAKARAQYAAMGRLKVGSGASLPRSRKSPELATVTPSSERIGRQRTRTLAYSQSQPTSRSASPSSQLSYHTFQNSSHTPRPRKLSGRGISGIPAPRSFTNSRETSREPSPTRLLSSLPKLRSSRGLTHRPMSSFDRPPSSSRPVMAQKFLQQSREAENALADALSFGDSHSSPNARKSFKSFDDHSDDSETSSVCSERSLDLLRPTSDDINEIIANCAKLSWAERKEGLYGLYSFLSSGNLLTPHEIKQVTELFTKMFMDSQTKVFTLFLDTLNEVIIRHQADLNDWLYVLLTKLLNKLGSDVLTSVGRKIQHTLHLVRDNFSTELQMNEILRFIIDPTQTHNTKVKIATLDYLTKLASEMEPADFNPGSGGRDPTAPALAKMINWTIGSESKGTVEVKVAAQEAIIALFNLNTPVITRKLSELSKEHQELASNLVQSHLRRSSSGTVPSASSLLPSSPCRQAQGQPRKMSNSCETENLDSDEIYKSLKRTTAEIQNYSYESKLLDRDRDRDTTSQDSGISQMSVGPGDRNEVCEERLDNFIGHGNNSGHSSSLSSPTQRIGSRELNSMEKTVTSDSFDEQDGYQEGSAEDEAEAWRNVLQTLHVENSYKLNSAQKEALGGLFRLVRQGSTLTLTQHFRKILKILMQLLPSFDSNSSMDYTHDFTVSTIVLKTITEMLKKPALTPLFVDFTELLWLKVMKLYEDTSIENKQVVRNAEICCSSMATVLPVDSSLKILNTVAKTKDYPMNMYAIKIITKVIQHQDKENVLPHLRSIMTEVIEACDNEESTVRKSAVFCIVALYGIVGADELSPFLDQLNASRRKLLNLYIKRHYGSSPPPKDTKNNSDKDRT